MDISHSWDMHDDWEITNAGAMFTALMKAGYRAYTIIQKGSLCRRCHGTGREPENVREHEVKEFDPAFGTLIFHVE